MTSFAKHVNRVQHLQVAGFTTYEGHNWREAILTYLNGAWAGDPSVCGRQELSLNQVTLRLGSEGKYYAYYVNGTREDTAPDVRINHTLFVLDPVEAEVEVGLIRFVRDEKVRQLALFFGGAQQVVLTKCSKRGEVLITSRGLLSMDEARRARSHQAS